MEGGATASSKESVPAAAVAKSKECESPSKNGSINDSKALVVNEAVVGVFLSLTDLPIPVSDPQKIDYYLRLMEPYLPGVTKNWMLFLADVQSRGHIGGFQKHLSEVKMKTIDYLNQQKSKLPPAEKKSKEGEKDKKSEASQSVPNEHQIKRPATSILKNVYQRECVNKTFLSIDVQEANYQAVAHLIPSMPRTWSLCVGQFTTSEFIRTCKYLRVICFGKSELRSESDKILGPRFVEPMREQMRSKLQWEAAVVSKDELVYEVKAADQKQSTTTIDVMLATVNSIVKETQQNWHLQLFDLNALGDRYQYFVKLHQYPMKRRQLKCVPTIHFRQAIRFDTQTPVEPNDLYFMCTESKELSQLVEPTQFNVAITPKKSDKSNHQPRQNK